MTASIWTEDRIDRLKTLWLAGKTADQIARDLAGGVTRSAVLGKVYRMGLSAGRPARGATMPARPAKARAAVSRQPAASPRLSPNDVAPERGLTSVLSVRHGQCRWPIGDPRKDDFSLCGQAVVRGAFCGPHAAVAYRPQSDSPGTLEGLACLS